VVNPCMVLMLVSPKKGLPIIKTQKKPTEENSDQYNESKTNYAARNNMTPPDDSITRLTPLLGGSYVNTKREKQVASGDDDSEFKDHEDSMYN
jgi:hypothetical protein